MAQRPLRAQCSRANALLLALIFLSRDGICSPEALYRPRNILEVQGSGSKPGNFSAAPSVNGKSGRALISSDARSATSNNHQRAGLRVLESIKGSLKQAKRSKGTLVPPATAVTRVRSSPPLDCTKHPGLCQPDTCEVWRPDVKNKCRYVQDKDACGADDSYIHYLELYYCGKIKAPIMALFFVAWLALLFYTMSVVAEVFLCPAVQYISERLSLPPDIAGVTLLAFASGAPDIFTQIAAINGGNAVELELAVSSVMGSGLFICCVSLAAILFVQRIEIGPKDRLSFVRDVVAYMVATAVTFAFLFNGRFALAEALGLIFLYILYICICIYTSRGGDPVTPMHRHGVLPTKDDNPFHGTAAIEMQQQRTLTSEELPLDFGLTKQRLSNGVPGMAHSGSTQPGKPSERVSVSAPNTPRAVRLQRSSIGGASPNKGSKGAPPTGPRGSMLTRRADSTMLDIPVSQLSNGTNSAQGTAAAPAAVTTAPPAADGWNSEWHLSDCVTALQIDEESGLSAAKATPLGVVSETAGGLQAATPQQAATGAMIHAFHRVGGVLRSVSDEYLHLGSSWAFNCVVVATAPLVLLMHATMPCVTRGMTSPRRCAALAIAAPAFALGVTCGPSLSTAAFLALWGGGAAALYGAMHASFLRGNCSNDSLHPRANAVFAVVAFAQSAVWLAEVADEVVAVLGASGAVLAIDEDLLGATVLAWGETLPDLFAMLAVARAGQGSMAVAACFGGPVLNLLVGTGAPVAVAAVRRGASLPFRRSPANTVLFAETVGLCAVLLAVVPTWASWGLSRRTAWALLATYLLFQILFLVAQQRWLF